MCALIRVLSQFLVDVLIVVVSDVSYWNVGFGMSSFLVSVPFWRWHCAHSARKCKGRLRINFNSQKGLKIAGQITLSTQSTHTVFLDSRHRSGILYFG